MPRIAVHWIAAIGLAMGLAGCASGTGVRPASPGAQNQTSIEDLNRIYADAIRHAAVVTTGDERPLRPLVAGPDGTVTVTTWAGCRGSAAANRCGDYVPGPITLNWDVWVGAAEEYADTCRQLRGDLVLKLSQLVGLPPPAKPIAADALERQFVTFSKVPLARVFRPCPDPRVDTDHCSGTTLPATLPSNAPPDYYRWFAAQAMSSWQAAPPDQPAVGYPWTRLGYTYNWAPEAASPYGISEYVISADSSPVTVEVVSVQTPKEFCRIP